MKTQSKLERGNKIISGLEKSYKKMLEFKKQRKSQVVVLREGRVVKLKPE